MRKVEVIITTGGVSMGELDLLKPTIERSLGGTIHFGRVTMKPGKPTTFATVPFKTNDGERIKRFIFSLPGNPGAAIVTLHVFVLAALQRMSGTPKPGLPKLMASLEHDVNLDAQRPEFHRAIVRAGPDRILYAASTGLQRSSRIGSLRTANALLILPARDGVMRKGEKVEAWMMGKIAGL
jgi:gephyrin